MRGRIETCEARIMLDGEEGEGQEEEEEPEEEPDEEGEGNTPPDTFNQSYEMLHDSTLSETLTAWDDDGDTLTFSVNGGVSIGSLVLHGYGDFTYTPPEGFVSEEPVTFQFTVTDGIETAGATVYIDVKNTPPTPVDDQFDYPAQGSEYVEIDVLENDFDEDSDAIILESVDPPSDGGTTTIVGDKIRYYPPAEYNSTDPETDVFGTGVVFNYTIVDSVGDFAQAQVEADPVAWTPWREYSRGNDDPNEGIYETAKVHVELELDSGNETINLKYTAMGSTGSHLKYDENGDIVVADPSDPEAEPEMEFWADTLYLQPWMYQPETPVSGEHAGVNLTWSEEGGVGGTLSGEYNVGEDVWGLDPLFGTAVIQMRMPDGQGGQFYGVVREEITWSVTFDADGNPSSASLSVREIPLPPEAGRLAVPLRIIDSSASSGLVYLVGYPPHPGVARQQDDPNTPEDERILPDEPIPDWDTKVPARDK